MTKLRAISLLIAGFLTMGACSDDGGGSDPTETTLSDVDRRELAAFDQVADVIDDPAFQELYELTDEDLGYTRAIVGVVLGSGFSPQTGLSVMGAYARGGGSEDKPMPLFSILWESVADPEGVDILNPCVMGSGAADGTPC